MFRHLFCSAFFLYNYHLVWWTLAIGLLRAYEMDCYMFVCLPLSLYQMLSNWIILYSFSFSWLLGTIQPIHSFYFRMVNLSYFCVIIPWNFVKIRFVCCVSRVCTSELSMKWNYFGKCLCFSLVHLSMSLSVSRRCLCWK